jgi:hypothetical protein
MADNWSSSVLVLAPGDWAKWTFTIPDTQAAESLNGINGGRCNFQARGRLRSGLYALARMINDLHGKIMQVLAGATAAPGPAPPPTGAVLQQPRVRGR